MILEFIYLMRCDCLAFYVGKTCQFQRRVHDHMYAISNVKIHTPIAHDIGLSHNFDLSILHFVDNSFPSNCFWIHEIFFFYVTLSALAFGVTAHYLRYVNRRYPAGFMPYAVLTSDYGSYSFVLE